MEAAKIDDPAADVTGYLHPQFARSCQEFGRPRELPRCRGWILERSIPTFSDTDAMGCYPLFACKDWSQLHLDIDDLQNQLVSLTLVTDPFGDYDEPYLHRCFPDLVLPFKEHFVIDLEKSPAQGVLRRHRKEARRALQQVSVHVHPDPPAFLDTWMNLHSHLIAKHNIKGIAAFSRSSFAAQLSVPGMVVLWASYGGEPVAATLYFVHDGVAHGHVLGSTDVGYEHGALYALIWSAIEHFRNSVRWINLMGVPGAQDVGSEGIRRFKLGWTRQTRTAWLCGRILNLERYAEIVRATGTSQTRYFPAYREGEMAPIGRESRVGATDSETSPTP
jgi:hypothetical protein